MTRHWIPAFAGMTISMICLGCSSPSLKPYSLTTPIAITGPEHLLLGQAININTADAKTLEALPHVGPALAKKIIQDRETHGPFSRMEDLLRVHGIGDKRLAQLRPYLQCR